MFLRSRKVIFALTLLLGSVFFAYVAHTFDEERREVANPGIEAYNEAVKAHEAGIKAYERDIIPLADIIQFQEAWDKYLQVEKEAILGSRVSVYAKYNRATLWAQYRWDILEFPEIIALYQEALRGDRKDRDVAKNIEIVQGSWREVLRREGIAPEQIDMLERAIDPNYDLRSSDSDGASDEDKQPQGDQSGNPGKDRGKGGLLSEDDF